MQLLQAVSDAWGWTGLRPRAITDRNAFGNLLVEDEDGAFWRICPEELTCTRIADDSRQFKRLTADKDFLADWRMARLVSEATAALGQPENGRCFCLKIPAVLGGEYAVANIGQIAVDELIRFSGNVAFQIKDTPDGSKVRFKLID